MSYLRPQVFNRDLLIMVGILAAQQNFQRLLDRNDKSAGIRGMLVFAAVSFQPMNIQFTRYRPWLDRRVLWPLAATMTEFRAADSITWGQS